MPPATPTHRVHPEHAHPVIRAPDRPGEVFCWIRGHEPIHHAPEYKGRAACGVEPKRWIQQSKLFAPITCNRCRRAMGWEPLTLQQGDYGYSPFIDYG